MKRFFAVIYFVMLLPVTGLCAGDDDYLEDDNGSNYSIIGLGGGADQKLIPNAQL